MVLMKITTSSGSDGKRKEDAFSRTSCGRIKGRRILGKSLLSGHLLEYQ
jgi:hypothetical protein